MGGAVSTGLGLALAQPSRRILVLTGDGEMLMGVGSLATVAAQQPENLAIGIIDNQHYGETGMQETHTAHGVDLAAMAAGAGIHTTGTVWDESDLEDVIPQLLNAPGPVFFDIKVTAIDQPMTLPEKDGLAIKHRFRAAVLGDAAQK